MNLPKTAVLDKQFLNDVKQTVDRFIKLGLLVVIKVHHFREAAEFPNENQQSLYALWVAFAPEIKDYPLEREEQRLEVNLGGFGAYRAENIESRARWTRAVCENCERRGFSWSYWELNRNFGISNPHELLLNQPFV